MHSFYSGMFKSLHYVRFKLKLVFNSSPELVDEARLTEIVDKVGARLERQLLDADVPLAAEGGPFPYAADLQFEITLKPLDPSRFTVRVMGYVIQPALLDKDQNPNVLRGKEPEKRAVITWCSFDRIAIQDQSSDLELRITEFLLGAVNDFLISFEDSKKIPRI